jgi:hypothetical protein
MACNSCAVLCRAVCVQDAGISFAEYATRAHARIAEIAAQQASVDAMQIRGPDQTATVAQASGAGWQQLLLGCSTDAGWLHAT